MVTIRVDGVQAIVFDLDRTLIISQRGFDSALRVAGDFLLDILRKHGVSKSRRELRRKIRLIAKSLEKRGLYDRGEWWRILFRSLGLAHLQGRLIDRATALYWREYAASSPLYSDAEKTVRTLHDRGYRLGFVSDTDGTPGMKMRRLRALPFYDLFEAVVVAGEDTKRIKPDKASFIRVAKELGLSPQDCVYVGDNPRVDVIGARKVGMWTVIVRRRSRLTGSRPDLTIDRLSRLLGIFKGER